MAKFQKESQNNYQGRKMPFSMILEKLDRYYRKSVTKLHDRKLAPLTDKEAKLAADFRKLFENLPSVDTTNLSLPEKEWMENAVRLKHLFLNNEPRQFLRWHNVSALMSAKHASYVKPEFNYLKNHPDWDSRLSKAIKEVQTGHPLPYYKYPQSSANLIHHAYHWVKFEKTTGLSVGDLSTILEFGGGYGSMCRLIRNLGFKGKYIIFDIPAFSLLQRFFFESIKLEDNHNSPQTRTGEQEYAICTSDIEELKNLLANNDQKGISLFLATWSFSEAAIKVRNDILPITSSFDAFLIGYQYKFNKIDNIAFFKNWKESFGNIQWSEWDINHLPNNRYLFGTKEPKNIYSEHSSLKGFSQ
ncbi:MAG: hypothetical protein WC374_00195 [Phycisphaerae bacterium]